MEVDVGRSGGFHDRTRAQRRRLLNVVCCCPLSALLAGTAGLSVDRTDAWAGLSANAFDVVGYDGTGQCLTRLAQRTYRSRIQHVAATGDDGRSCSSEIRDVTEFRAHVGFRFAAEASSTLQVGQANGTVCWRNSIADVPRSLTP
ncbi:hypothetical protein MRX96_009527 [Rhipicephalus microplus]